jgi:hypothetical protein
VLERDACLWSQVRYLSLSGRLLYYEVKYHFGPNAHIFFCPLVGGLEQPSKKWRKEGSMSHGAKKKEKEETYREMKKGAALGIRVCVDLLEFSYSLLFSCSNPLKLVKREYVRERKFNGFIIFLYCKIIFI